MRMESIKVSINVYIEICTHVLWQQHSKSDLTLEYKVLYIQPGYSLVLSVWRRLSIPGVAIKCRSTVLALARVCKVDSCREIIILKVWRISAAPLRSSICYSL